MMGEFEVGSVVAPMTKELVQNLAAKLLSPIDVTKVLEQQPKALEFGADDC